MEEIRKEERTLHEDIHDYWSNRAKGYSEYNQQELEDERRFKWKKKLTELIGAHYPDRKPEEIRVLDVGTGPGFFALLLSEAGYQVSAVDCTEEMLKEAGKNTGVYAKQISWHLDDVQEMTAFSSETFDVLVTRNVTWNLEKPQQAYEQWYRVLKKGGVLFNFDADWYGHLFSEEKMKKHEIDRRNIEEQDVVDLEEGTDTAAMDKIARAVPLSRVDRPEWDLKAMAEVGYDVTCDREVWREVWGIDDIVNCSGSPLFLLTGKK